MRKQDSQPWMIYVNPATLANVPDLSQLEHPIEIDLGDEIGISSPLMWSEMIQDIELGNKEFEVLIKLSEKADLSMVHVVLLFLHYWEEKSEKDLAKMYEVDQATISRELTRAREKLHRPLLDAIQQLA